MIFFLRKIITGFCFIVHYIVKPLVVNELPSVTYCKLQPNMSENCLNVALKASVWRLCQTCVNHKKHKTCYLDTSQQKLYSPLTLYTPGVLSQTKPRSCRWTCLTQPLPLSSPVAHGPVFMFHKNHRCRLCSNMGSHVCGRRKWMLNNVVAQRNVNYSKHREITTRTTIEGYK